MKKSREEIAIKNIRAEINKRGIKQKTIAERCGMNDTLFSSLMQGRKKLTIDILVDICYALDVSSDELLSLKQERE